MAAEYFPFPESETEVEEESRQEREPEETEQVVEVFPTEEERTVPLEAEQAPPATVEAQPVAEERTVITEEAPETVKGERPEVQVKPQLARNLKGKALVNIHNGEKLGEVEDILFDTDALRVAALTRSAGSLLSRRTEALPAEHVVVWGKDAILVDSAKMIDVKQLPKYDRWVRLSDNLNGRYVVSTDGVRIGQVSDVIIDEQGRVSGYRLSQAFVEGKVKDKMMVPVEATSSLGKDVLIVDRSKF